MFDPNLQILPDAQRSLWPQLHEVPEYFVLYGGTAIALRLGHRESIDFDFFSNKSFIPSELMESLPCLKNAIPLQSSDNTLVCRTSKDVQVSFFGGLSLNRVQDPETAEENQIKIASLLDLAATKTKVILDRASWKDYYDLATLVEHGIDLSDALSAACNIYGKAYNPLLSLKALSYFEGGDLSKLSESMCNQLLKAVKSVDAQALPSLEMKKGLFEGSAE